MRTYFGPSVGGRGRSFTTLWLGFQSGASSCRSLYSFCGQLCPVDFICLNSSDRVLFPCIKECEWAPEDALSLTYQYVNDFVTLIFPPEMDILHYRSMDFFQCSFEKNTNAAGFRQQICGVERCCDSEIWMCPRWQVLPDFPVRNHPEKNSRFLTKRETRTSPEYIFQMDHF